MKLHKKLIGGSIVLLVTFNIFNLLNFFFQFSMVRLLPIADYGALAALFSIIYILGIFSESIPTIISKYSAKESNSGKLKNLLKRSLKKASFLSILLFIIFLIISLVLSKKLNLPYSLLALTGLMIFAAFFTSITRGLMQGRKRFSALGVNMVIESAFKLILAIILVLMGWAVYGAMFATVVGAIFAFIISFIPLYSIIKSKESKVKTPKIYQYTPPVFLITSVIIVFYSIDVLIARAVFPDLIAGYYAISSTLAKIIFIGTFPISKAMFPFTAESDKNKKNAESILTNSVAIISLIIFVSLIVTFFFSKFIVWIYSGNYIPESASILFLLALANGLISLANLILLYKLSIGQIKGYKYFFIFLLLEVIVLRNFSHNLVEFSIAFITVSAIFLWGSIYLLRK